LLITNIFHKLLFSKNIHYNSKMQSILQGLPMKPIALMSSKEASCIRYVLMDIDDTLTRDGKLLSSSYAALWKLKEAGLKLIPVTGRSAGWCDLIAREWPVDGVIGENGALAFWEEPGQVLKAEYHPNAIWNNNPVLERVKERALGEFPELRPAKDQFSRLFDLALDFAEEGNALPLSAAERVKEIANEEGAIAKVSSIHINIWMGNYDKLSMSERFLAGRFGWEAGAGDGEIVFVGDSPNDEPMFARFPLACAVANISRYVSLLRHFPAYVASKECGDGFAEIAEAILEKRRACE
jgi:HAD superfamily hydrolase (TIGR01484 family)